MEFSLFVGPIYHDDKVIVCKTWHFLCDLQFVMWYDMSRYIEGIVHLIKNQKLIIITYPHFIPNWFELLSFCKRKRRKNTIFWKVAQKCFCPFWDLTDIHCMDKTRLVILSHNMSVFKTSGEKTSICISKLKLYWVFFSCTWATKLHQTFCFIPLYINNVFIEGFVDTVYHLYLYNILFLKNMVKVFFFLAVESIF